MVDLRTSSSKFSWSVCFAVCLIFSGRAVAQSSIDMDAKLAELRMAAAAISKQQAVPPLTAVTMATTVAEAQFEMDIRLSTRRCGTWRRVSFVNGSSPDARRFTVTWTTAPQFDLSTQSDGMVPLTAPCQGTFQRVEALDFLSVVAEWLGSIQDGRMELSAEAGPGLVTYQYITLTGVRKQIRFDYNSDTSL